MDVLLSLSRVFTLTLTQPTLMIFIGFGQASSLARPELQWSSAPEAGHN